jgi:predicted tellurium resistance membrane protein TerC
MSDLFTLSNFMTLGMLTLLQIVLGFDNLLYISLESKRVTPDRRRYQKKLLAARGH